MQEGWAQYTSSITSPSSLTYTKIANIAMHYKSNQFIRAISILQSMLSKFVWAWHIILLRHEGHVVDTGHGINANHRPEGLSDGA